MEDGVEDNTQFASQEYWESRYKAEAAEKPTETFEWVKGWSFYKDAITPLLRHPESSETTTIDMLQQSGFMNHTNLDYSPAVIETMRTVFAEYSETVKWVVGDIFELEKTVERNSFDVVIDKGTLDAFLTGFPDDDPWDPSEEVWDLVRKYMGQVHSAIKPGGLFIHITWAQPHFRRRFCEVTGMDVSVKKVGTDWEYFVYVARKKE
ncbi:S-adenosyl-L-methionine-dependent methyltransferase [Obelidium mucronatum]|nr:S-adenosyl-L-methionine-dependent methyltransferase [Obelidium mucronatum]